MYVASLIQKKVQKEAGNKGLTVLVMDDNKMEMPALSDAIYAADPWFDGLYQLKETRRRRRVWVARTPGDRFDHIINTAFAIKSNHSSLVQVADALSYVYRRRLELRTEAEAYAGKKAFYDELIDLVEERREKLGHCPDCEAARFYKGVAPDGWSV